MTNTLFAASNWREERAGTLVGRVTLSIRYLGLTIDGVGVHQQGERSWVTMPSFVTEGRGGRRQFMPVIRFGSREERDEFSDIAIEAVNELLNGAGL